MNKNFLSLLYLFFLFLFFYITLFFNIEIIRICFIILLIGLFFFGFIGQNFILYNYQIFFGFFLIVVLYFFIPQILPFQECSSGLKMGGVSCECDGILYKYFDGNKCLGKKYNCKDYEMFYGQGFVSTEEIERRDYKVECK